MLLLCFYAFILNNYSKQALPDTNKLTNSSKDSTLTQDDIQFYTLFFTKYFFDNTSLTFSQD